MFKQMLRARAKKVGKNAAYLQQYPDQPTGLPATVRERFLDAEGGELNPGSVVAGGPLRGSHKTLKNELQLVPAVQHSAALQSSNTMMELLRNCSLMMQQQQQQQQSCMLPGFRWLTSNPQASGATAPASSTESIALNSPSAGQALQDTPSVAGATVPGGTKEDESQEVAAENDAVAHGHSCEGGRARQLPGRWTRSRWTRESRESEASTWPGTWPGMWPEKASRGIPDESPTQEAGILHFHRAVHTCCHVQVDEGRASALQASRLLQV